MDATPDLERHRNAEQPMPTESPLRDGAPPDHLAICARGLEKHFRHPWTLKLTRALSDLDLDVRRGEVFGYLGPNGAGKTTTIKLLVGLLRPSRGNAWLLGHPIGTEASRRRVGLLPE